MSRQSCLSGVISAIGSLRILGATEPELCSTGIGMSIIANKYAGIRASLCTSHYMGKITRAHNNSNVLCLAGRVTGVFEALDILDAWLETSYEGGRHDISLGLISEAENALSTRNLWSPDDPMMR